MKKTADVAEGNARSDKREQKKHIIRKEKNKDYDKIGANRKISSWNIEDKITEEELDKKVNELVGTRGKKNTDPRVVLRQLEVLTKVARVYGARKEIPVLSHLISAMFDSKRLIDGYMDHQQWRTCFRSLSRILKLLDKNPSLVLGTISSEEVADLIINAQIKTVADSTPSEEAKSGEKEKKNVVKTVGTIESFIIRLENEYTKSLQQINLHT